MSDQNFWIQLTSQGGLLAIGGSLAMFGFLLRGFAVQSRRAAALRQQHWIHTRRLGESEPLDNKPGWFERHVSFIANAVLAIGGAIAFAAFFRG